LKSNKQFSGPEGLSGFWSFLSCVWFAFAGSLYLSGFYDMGAAQTNAKKIKGTYTYGLETPIENRIYSGQGIG
jgi:hypothetical protein